MICMKTGECSGMVASERARANSEEGVSDMAALLIRFSTQGGIGVRAPQGVRFMRVGAPCPRIRAYSFLSVFTSEEAS